MARMTWLNGNQGSYRYFDVASGYGVERAGTSSLTLTRFSGTDDTAPYRIKLILQDAEQTEDAYGRSHYTAGQITKIFWYDSDGDLTHKATGLSLDLNLASTFYNTGNDNALKRLIYSQVDTFVGSNNSRNPDGWDGDDIATGHGDDTVRARAGDDYIGDNGGSDYYNGGSGFDELSYASTFWNPHLIDTGITADLQAGTIEGPDGHTDRVVSIEALRGTHLADAMLGDDRDFNSFRGLQGNDTIDGRGGIDEVRYDRDYRFGGTFGVTVDLARGTATDGFGNTDTLLNIERVRGSYEDDVLRDDRGDNRLRGLDGNDTLRASQGDDELEGGYGADVFQFKGKNFGNDVIWDFELGTDLIEITSARRFRQLDIEDDGNGNALISFAGETIQVDNISADDLSKDDFLF